MIYILTVLYPTGTRIGFIITQTVFHVLKVSFALSFHICPCRM